MLYKHTKNKKPVIVKNFKTPELGPLAEWLNIKTELEPIMAKNDEKLPTIHQLIEMGRTDLVNAIRNHHGGFKKVKEKLGGTKTPIIIGIGGLRNWDNFKATMIIAIENNKGIFPTRKVLKNQGRIDLRNFAKHHGGLRAIKARLLHLGFISN